MSHSAMSRSGSTSHRVISILAVVVIAALLGATPCLASGTGTGEGVKTQAGPAASSVPNAGAKPKAEAIPKDDPRSIEAQRLAGRTANGGSEAGPVWYLAEGTTAWGFDTAIAIENPNNQAVTVRMTYMTNGGPIVRPNISLATLSVLWIHPDKEIGHQDFSTKVECLEGLPIAVDRTIDWYDGGPSHDNTGTTYSVGVTAPSNSWYLPEGSTGGDFETFILVQNPNDVAVQVLVNFMNLTGPVGQVTLNIAPRSRRTVNVADTVPNTWSVSTWVACKTQPIIAERSMYWADRTEGHDSIGTPAPATSWLLSEGCTAADFETWVLVQNPNDYTVTANYDYMTSAGFFEGGSVELGPFSRSTVYVNEQMPDEWGVSTIVTSKDLVIAERAMYGNGRAWGHDSIGMDSAHDVLLLPGGGTHNDWETWVLVQNPYKVAAYIDVYYLTEANSKNNYHFSDTLAPYSRKTYNMGAVIGVDNNAAAMIVCRTSGVKVVAEMASYLMDVYGARISAGDTIGGYLDVE